MKKKLLLTCVSMLFLASVFAVVSRPGLSMILQPDGYMLQSRLLGDEYFHFRRTMDGYTLLQNSAGCYVYAVDNGNGGLIASAVEAHNPSDRNKSELDFLNSIKPYLTFGETVNRQLAARRAARSKSIRNGQMRTRALNKTVTTKRYLVILVNFSDNAFSVSSPQTRFNNQFNAESYTTDGATGSVRKYFEDNSMGNYSPQFDVYGPVTLSKTMAYYGGNDTDGNDLHPQEMIFEACKLLDGQIDFSLYDADSDGTVDNVYVVYAGYGEASGASANTVWPHQWEVTDTTKLDGKCIGSYSCSNELSGTSGTVIDGIGTACHEFSHAIGLPDLYDTDYETNGQSFDVDTWSLMASGCYNNEGMTPPYYCAVERELLGWGTAVEISTASNQTLNSIGTNQFYKINTPTANEYFLIENRQLTGWDSYLYGHGMIIYHVDKTSTYASRWTDNTINAYSAHNCVDVVEADGKGVIYDGTNASAYLASVKADPFPGTSLVTGISDTSTPNLKSWGGAASGKPISSIAESNAVITFKLMGGEPVFGAFSALAATDILSGGFTANWSAATNATKYLLNVYTKKQSGASPITVVNAFDNFPGTQLANWTSSVTTTYTSSGNYGVSSPSVKLGATNAYVQTPVFSDIITAASFWYKGNGTDKTSSLTIAGSADGTTWTTIETMSGLAITGTTKTISIDKTKGYKTLRFLYTKSVGNLALDDISITYGQSSVVTHVLTDQEVNAATSYALSGLAAGTYYYTVKASNGTDVSDESNEIEVVLLTSLLKDVNLVNVSVRSAHDGILIDAEAADHVSVYDMTGKLVVDRNINQGSSFISLRSGTLYLIRTNSGHAKVWVK